MMYILCLFTVACEYIPCHQRKGVKQTTEGFQFLQWGIPGKDTDGNNRYQDASDSLKIAMERASVDSTPMVRASNACLLTNNKFDYMWLKLFHHMKHLELDHGKE